MWAAIVAAVSLSLAPALDLDRLPTGAEPRIAWWGDGALHDGDRAYDLGEGAMGGFARTEGGFAVRQLRDQEDALLFVDRDGTTRTLDTAPGDTHDLFGPVAADNRIAWTAVDGLDGDTQRSRIVVADGRTSRELHRREVDEDLRPVGFLSRDRLILKGRERSMIWNSTTDELTAWKGARAVTAARPGLAAAVDGDDCTSVVGGPAGTFELWRTCDVKITAFSADGERAIGVRPAGPGATQVRVLESRTGKEIGRITVGGDGTACAEAGEDVLISAWDDRRQALVRWTASAHKRFIRIPAELATPLAKGGGYVLPSC